MSLVQASSLAVLSLAALSLSPAAGSAQKLLYADYPQPRIHTQEISWSSLPVWVSFDMELRGRTEGQTAFSLASGVDRDYELTRVRGGLELRPSPFLTVYAQFHDTHALGLPLHTVSANMRDEFDFRQGFVDLHHGPVHLFAVRQELKLGGERLVGVIDWTNNSRTFDGFDLRLGKANRVDLFTASVITIDPTSLDKHGAGLTFHGIDASITTIPKVPDSVAMAAGRKAASTLADFGLTWRYRVAEGTGESR